MQEFLIGIAGGLAASIVFLLALSFFRPRVHISPCIARSSSASDDDEYPYAFKIVNKSRRPCLDLDVRIYSVLESASPTEDEGEFGTHRKMWVVGTRNLPEHLPGYRRRANGEPYAHRVQVKGKAVDALLDTTRSQFIMVRVTARDSWTDFPRIASREYRLSSQVKDGVFQAGKSLDVAASE